MYLDTCIEPWPGGYTDPTIPAAKRTNYALREEALALRSGNARAPTAVLTHGANPGLVSHLVKQALLNIAARPGRRATRSPAAAPSGPSSRSASGVKVIHIAERDTQVSTHPEGAERIRQHLVGRRLRLGRLAAGGAGLGHARAQFSARRSPLRFRRRRGDLPGAAGRGDAGAQLDAAQRARTTGS